MENETPGRESETPEMESETPGGQYSEDRPAEAGEAPAPAPSTAYGAPATPHTPPSPPNGNGPAQTVLENLNKALQKANQEAAQSQELSKALQADVQALAAAYGDVDKAVEAYGKERSSLDQQRTERKEYIAKKDDLILSAIEDRKDEVDAFWDAVGTEIETLVNRLEQNETTLVGRTRAYEDKQRAVQKAQEKFDKIKNRQAALGDWLKQLAALKTGIEAAEDKGDAVGLYVRFREYKRLLDLIDENLSAVDDYRRQLELAWSELKKRKDELRDAAKARTQAQNELELTKAELERLRKNRVTEVINRVPPAPASSRGPATTIGSRP
jgi:DNA repair exonuclease SbcCD ATPase subunit